MKKEVIEKVYDLYFQAHDEFTKEFHEENPSDYTWRKNLFFNSIEDVATFLVETYGEQSILDDTIIKYRHMLFPSGDIWKYRGTPHCSFAKTADNFYMVTYDEEYAEINPTLFVSHGFDVERKKRDITDEKHEDEILRELLTVDEYKALQLYRECDMVEYIATKDTEDDAYAFAYIADDNPSIRKPPSTEKWNYTNSFRANRGKIRAVGFQSKSEGGVPIENAR